MYKALAVVRTVFLVFIVAYTVRAMPVFSTVARTFDEQYARCSDSLNLVLRAAWIAIAWIALETVLGWVVARRRAASPAAPGTPPPPPRP